ncbi:MAG: YceI family protein [Bacteroidota bacterium]
MKQIYALTLAVILLFSTVFTQTKWNVDKSHTMINFSVEHMVISEVTGQFKEFDATMETSKEDFTDAKINVSIKAKSIDTGTPGRDNHLRSADFFNAEIDSTITFVSSKVEKTGNETFKITGALTMRGVTKEVVLNTKYKGKVKGMRGAVSAFKATTSINRKEWGLSWNRTIETGGFVVGENVELSIVIEFIEAKA